MIGYKMGYSPAGACTTTQTPPVEHFKHEWKINDLVANMTTLFVRGVVLRRSSFSSNFEPSEKNLTSGEVQLDFFKIIIILRQ